MTSVSLVDWKIEPRRLSVRRSFIALDRLPLWATANPPSASSANKRLDVAERRFRRWSNSGHGRSRCGRRGAHHLVAVEVAGDVAHRPVRVEMGAVEAGDAGRFLAAVLQRVEAERDEARRIVGAPDAENAAFLAQLVVIEGIGRQHVPALGLTSRDRHIGSPAPLSPLLNQC